MIDEKFPYLAYCKFLDEFVMILKCSCDSNVVIAYQIESKHECNFYTTRDHLKVDKLDIIFPYIFK